MARHDDTFPPASALEGPEWADRRPLTPAEEEDAWKIAQLTATLMGPDGVDGDWPHWEDAVSCGASLLEISRRHVLSEAK